MQRSELGQVPVTADETQGDACQLACKRKRTHIAVPGHNTLCTGHTNVQSQSSLRSLLVQLLMQSPV